MKIRAITKTTASSSVPEALTQRAVTSISRSGITCTCVTAEAHQYLTGDFVTFSGANQAEYNRTFQITVVDSTTFTFVLAESPATISTLPTTPATGTIIAIGRIEAIKAIVQPGKGDGGRTANTGNVWVGRTSTNDAQPSLLSQPTDQLIIDPTPAKYFNLGDFYLDVATNADGVHVQLWPRI